VTVPVDGVRGVAGFVLPDDFVDIVIIADDGSTKHQSHSDILLEHIKVLAIDQAASEGQGQPTVAKAVTVEVTKEQAQKILLATNIGKLSLILSRPVDSNPDPNRRVSEKDIGRTSPSLRDPRTSGQGSSAAAVEYGDDFRFPKWGNQAVLGDAQRRHEWQADDRERSKRFELLAIGRLTLTNACFPCHVHTTGVLWPIGRRSSRGT